MKPVQTYRLHCLSEALSPITHMRGTSGNEALINRHKLLVGDVLRECPVISANAIRHRMVRDPGALYLIERLGLSESLTVPQANYLLNGGSLYRSSVSDNLGKIARLQQLFPLMRLLGGSLPDQIIGGSLYVKFGLLVCEEYRALIGAQLPDGYALPEGALRPFEDFVSGYQYTRGDVRRHPRAKDVLAPAAADGPASEEEAKGEKSGLMIYAGESIIAGACFYHGFLLRGVSPLEAGALLHAIALWQETDGTLGGQARIGHGQLRLRILSERQTDFYGIEMDASELVGAYVEHVERTADEARAWLLEAFAEPKKKGARKSAPETGTLLE